MGRRAEIPLALLAEDEALPSAEVRERARVLLVDDEDAGALAVVIAEVVELGVQRHSQPLRTASRCIGSTGLER